MVVVNENLKEFPKYYQECKHIILDSFRIACFLLSYVLNMFVNLTWLSRYIGPLGPKGTRSNAPVGPITSKILKMRGSFLYLGFSLLF